MKMRICVYACMVCFALCGTAVAGPLDNASQFQQKAAASAMKKPSSNAWKYTATQPARQTGEGIVSPPSDLRLEDAAGTSGAAEDAPLRLRLEEPAEEIAPESQSSDNK